MTFRKGGLWACGVADAPQQVGGLDAGHGPDIAQAFAGLPGDGRPTDARRPDLAPRVSGPDAGRWLDIAQAFAGPPGGGRPPKGDTP